MIVKPTVENLAKAAKEASGKGAPPVHLWAPDIEVAMDLRIDRDGAWYHDGGVISRPGLVKLFASILRRDPDGFFLVTPVEKARVEVEDAPFVAQDFEVAGLGTDQQITVFTNVEDAVAIGPHHPIRMGDSGAPYVMVRNGLEARIDRKSFYRLVELGTEATVNDQDSFGLWAGGTFFPL